MANTQISKAHNSITQHLIDLSKIANQNLELLNSLNASLFTGSSQVRVEYNDESFYIPSFIYLDTRVAELEENLKKIVEVPKSGMTGVVYPKDGSIQKIVHFGYDNQPNRVNNLIAPNVFGIENNYFFKDFITPNVYLTFDLTNDITDNIKQVNVKKIIVDKSLYDSLYPLSEGEIKQRNELIALISKNAASESQKKLLDELNAKLMGLTYGDVKSKLYLLQEGIDYKEFDKVYTLPYKNKRAYGDFQITEVEADSIDVKNAQNITATVSLDTFVYYTDQGAITNELEPGDFLITADDKAVWKILSLDANTMQAVIELVEGYTTLRVTEDNPGYYLKYYEYASFDHILKVSLEEDPYILIFISPINSELNLLAPWSNAVFVDVYNLLNGQEKFVDYYNKNVKNLGDILQGLMDEINIPLYMLNDSSYEIIKNIKPTIDPENLKVVAINEHLNDSANLDDLKRLHTQKNELKNKLTVIQNDLDNIQDILASNSFDNTSELMRQGYENQYNSLLAEKRLNTQELVKIVNEISLKSSSNVIPLGKTKYRIRGYISNDPLAVYKDASSESYNSAFEKIDVIKWIIEYRYKNATSDNTKAESIGEDNFIFTSWNIQDSIMRKKIGSWNDDKKTYEYRFETPVLSENNPSYHQVDIPIQQGEDVEIRCKALLNIGYPYITVETGMSQIVTVEFPEELKVNVDIIDIVEQNNKDAEEAKFTNILVNDGYQEHIDNRIIDQDKTYFHQPEQIASGYYTAERRIVPLKDKLTEIVNQVNTLEKTITGSQNNILKVTISDGTTEQVIVPNSPAEFYVQNYYDAQISYNKQQNDPTKQVTAPVIRQKLYLNITNPTAAAINIYSLLPGANNMPLGEISTIVNSALLSQSNLLRLITKQGNQYTVGSSFDYNNSYLNTYQAFPIRVGEKWTTQRLGQFLYFRTINPFKGISYFDAATPTEALNGPIYSMYENSWNPDSLEGNINKDYISSDITNYKILTYKDTTVPLLTEMKNLNENFLQNVPFYFVNEHPLKDTFDKAGVDVSSLFTEDEWKNAKKYYNDGNPDNPQITSWLSDKQNVENLKTANEVVIYDNNYYIYYKLYDAVIAADKNKKTLNTWPSEVYEYSSGLEKRLMIQNLAVLYGQSKLLGTNDKQILIQSYDVDKQEFTVFKGSFNEEADGYSKGVYTLGAYLYPQLMDWNTVSCGTGLENASRLIQPNETISIPVNFEYRLADGNINDINTTTLAKIQKTIAFDIRTSLFRDPEIYIANVIATLNPTTNEETLKNTSSGQSQLYSPTIVE